MEDKKIKEIQRKVVALLDEQRLKQAIEALGEEIETLQDWELCTRYNEMKMACHYMLDFLRQGMPDPDRERMHGELVGRCYILNDLIAVSRLTEHSTSVYCQMRRKHRNLERINSLHSALKENASNISVTDSLPTAECRSVREQLFKEREQLLQQLFGAIWSSAAWDKAGAEAIKTLICDT